MTGGGVFESRAIERVRRAAPTLVFVCGVAAILLAAVLEALASRGFGLASAEIGLAPLDALSALAALALCRYGVYPLVRSPSMTARYWRSFRANRAAVWSLGVLAVVVAAGTVGPLLIERPELNVTATRQPPVFATVPTSVSGSCVGPVIEGACRGSWRYPLGTTPEGRDLLASLVYGARVSLQVGLTTTVVIVAIGTAVGTVAAYSGGGVDAVLMRYVDLQMTFPTFFLYLLLLYLYGGTLFLLVVIFGLTSWGQTARLVRGEALQRREEPYVEAARSIGLRELQIVRRYVVPNVANTIVTNATLLIPSLVLFEATFSFLGLVDPSIPSWGRLIAAGRGDVATAWWVSTIPGVALFATVLALNFVGDGLRDALDPRVER